MSKTYKIEISPAISLCAKNILATNGSEENVRLTFREMEDFTPEQVTFQFPRLTAMPAIRRLLRDLKVSLLNNITFRKVLETILRSFIPSDELGSELSALAAEKA